MAGAAALLPSARALRAQQQPPVAGGPSDPLWNFDSVTGPEHWSELSPDYALCQFGMEQSPVDLVDALKVSGSEALKIDYRPLTAHVVRAGWTLEIAFEP
jgi:carbonic anhydrase